MHVKDEATDFAGGIDLERSQIFRLLRFFERYIIKLPVEQLFSFPLFTYLFTMSTNVHFFQIVLSILKSFKTICGRITFALYTSFNKVLAKEHVTV